MNNISESSALLVNNIEDNGGKSSLASQKSTVNLNEGQERTNVLRLSSLTSQNSSVTEASSSESSQAASSNDGVKQPDRTAIINLLPKELQKKATDLFSCLENIKSTFWQDCSNNRNDLNTAVIHNIKAVTQEENIDSVTITEFSKKAKKELLPFSTLWKAPIEEEFSSSETGFSNYYRSLVTPYNEGVGVCKRDDEHSMNAWGSQLFRKPKVSSSDMEGENSSPNLPKRIHASLRCAAWIPTSSSLGSTLARQVTRFTTWMGYKPPGEQRLIDNLTSVFSLQAEDPTSAAGKTLRGTKTDSPENSKKNPLTLSMFSNSLVSGCVMGGTDPEGYLQDMQLALIKYANEREEPFELKIKVNGQEKSVWVKPAILMLSSPVQSKDRWLMRWSCGLLGVRNHASNVKAVTQLKTIHSEYKKQQLLKLDSFIKENKDKEALELALNIKADQELMDEILEMSKNPKDLEKGMYGDNYGNPHAFNSRVAVLCQRMGITPINNCKTGKDRTEDSEVAQKLLAAEIDEKTEKKKVDLLRWLSDIPQSSTLITLLDYIRSKTDLNLVPRRDFLSAENLKKQVVELGLEENVKNEVINVINNYSPGKPKQKNLFQEIRDLFSPDSAPEILDKQLTSFEQVAHRRMVFGFSRAGFTIQMLNNKTKLLWGNKQERYPDYYFGLSSEEIEAVSKLMRPEGKVSA
jgi:hypothetical protein